MNNNRNTNTREYSTTRYLPRHERSRRHQQKKFILFIFLALLIILLAAAIVFVAIELIGTGGDETTAPSTDGSEGSSPIISGDHAMIMAYDGDPTTYMLSVTKQSKGSYYSCEFSSQAEISSVTFVSSEADYYVRGCEVQIKVGGSWTTIGLFGGSAGEKTYTVTSGAGSATAVRILLTENADVLWAVNEITVTDVSGNTVALRSPSAGTGTVQGPDNTGSSDVTTGSPDVTTENTGKPTLGYTTIVVSNENMHTGALILVNSQYAFRFPASQASLLNVYDEYAKNNYHCNYFDGNDVQLEAIAAKNLLLMANAIYTDTGLNNLKIGTGYRSYEKQQDLSNRYPTTAALPGYSEHHTGLGIDLQVWDRALQVTYDLGDTNQNCQMILGWINSNAYKYGFVRRFAPDKDIITGISSDRWHYRYVGAPHAYYMATNNLCLEEYLAALEKCTYTGNHLFINDVDGHDYEVYFVPASAGSSTNLPVPTDPSTYTVSGNNYSGYIVTVTLN